MALLPIIGGALGALGGLFSPSAPKPSAYEQWLGGASQGAMQGLQGMMGAGPGMSDVAAGAQSQRDLASLFQNYAGGGYLPSAANFQSGQSQAAMAFAPQQEQLRQSFQEQLNQANRAAALAGRGSNDPILRARLAQQQTQQQSLLSAQQGAFANQLAYQQPLQQLQFAQQGANILQGLGNQAISNQTSLAQLFNQSLVAQQQSRLSEKPEPNVFGQVLSGAVGGLGSGFDMASKWNALNFSGGGDGGGSTYNMFNGPNPSAIPYGLVG